MNQTEPLLCESPHHLRRPIRLIRRMAILGWTGDGGQNRERVERGGVILQMKSTVFPIERLPLFRESKGEGMQRAEAFSSHKQLRRGGLAAGFAVPLRPGNRQRQTKWPPTGRE